MSVEQLDATHATVDADAGKKVWSDPVCVEVKLSDVTAAMGLGGGDESIFS
jgi:hypothetical protein